LAALSGLKRFRVDYVHTGILQLEDLMPQAQHGKSSMFDLARE
jgi:hypothetical protein